jgi:hypothetical protein
LPRYNGKRVEHMQDQDAKGELLGVRLDIRSTMKELTICMMMRSEVRCRF